jgi:hypothetical protein
MKTRYWLLGWVFGILLGGLAGYLTNAQAQNFTPIKNSAEPIYAIAAVTPNDSVDLSNECRALYVGSNGNIRIDAPGGATNILFAAAKGGSTIPVRVKRVRATGTTVTNIVCLY